MGATLARVRGPALVATALLIAFPYSYYHFACLHFGFLQNPVNPEQHLHGIAHEYNASLHTARLLWEASFKGL